MTSQPPFEYGGGAFFVYSSLLYFRVFFACRPNAPLVFCFFVKFVAGLETKCPAKDIFWSRKDGFYWTSRRLGRTFQADVFGAKVAETMVPKSGELIASGVCPMATSWCQESTWSVCGKLSPSRAW